MKSAAKLRAGQSAIVMVENAVHLLRSAPAGALLSYYTGSIPFALGLLFFVSDMSGGAYARQHIIEASLSVTGLYLWMKCWHTVFGSKLLAHVMLRPEEPWTIGRIVRMVFTQVALQPVGLFLCFVSAQVVLPYVWVYGLFQTAGILGDGTRESLREIVRVSSRQAWLRVWAAHRGLGAIFLFTLFVWLNICFAFILTPKLLKMFFGVETIFSRNLMTLFNSTTIAATLAATYLCIDPIRKAFYVLRCFHGTSLQTGEDLRVELRARTRSTLSPVLTLLLAVLLVASPCAPVRAEQEPPPPARMEAAELDGAVDRVLQRREYAWRLPREAEKADDAKKGWLGTFFDDLWNSMRRLTKTVSGWLKDFQDWLRKKDHDKKPRDYESGRSGNGAFVARGTLYVLLAALVIVIVFLLLRWGVGRRAETAVAESATAIPDLNEENVTADQLPEDGWLQLARGLMERGDLRLALRALYLAGLAHLGQRDLIRIAKHKSNWDYDRELRRRALGNDALLSAFDDNLAAFEASWYGEHTVTREGLGGFEQNLERIRAC